MTKSEIVIQVLDCFAVVFPDISSDSLAAMERGNYAQWDSVMHVTLVTVLEESFGLRFDYDAFVGVDSASKVIAQVAKKLEMES